MRTRPEKLLTASILLLSVLVPAAWAQELEVVNASSIIFIGTVDKVGEVSFSSLSASPNTSVVSVEEVAKKPEAVSLAPGDKVTVLTQGPDELNQGDRALFYTEGWVFGEGLAVRVLAWEPAAQESEAAAVASNGPQTALAEQLRAAEDADLLARIDKAEIIVSGRVKRIQAPTAPALAAPEREIISEHNPDWKEAVIEVQTALKGAEGLEEVVVRFPDTLDVMWFDYPKFQEGQEGTFLLQQDPVSGVATATLGVDEVTAYMASSSQDVLSKDEAARIQELIERPR